LKVKLSNIYINILKNICCANFIKLAKMISYHILIVKELANNSIVKKKQQHLYKINITAFA